MGLPPDDDEVATLRADVDALSVELLNRYEEITLLYDLARDLGVVLDIDQVAQSALARSLQVIPASLGMVLVGDSAENLRVVAEQHRGAPDDERCRLGRRAVAAAISAGTQLLANTGDRIGPGETAVAEPALVSPLHVVETVGGEPATVGAVAFVGHELSDRFSAGEAKLGEVVANQLSQGITNAGVLAQMRDLERMQRELELAADIQRSLLPRRTPRVPRASFAARCLPATQVGGDYFDFVLGMDGLISFLVADVSGHGLGPGLIMAMTRSALRAELRNPGSLAQSLYDTNSVMWDDLSATEAFITMFAARYDPQSQRLHYVNAGHHPALLRRRDGAVEELTAFGMPLGIVSTSSYEEQSRDLQPGDIVVVFSDGVVEAAAPDGSLFGTERLRALTAQTLETTAEGLVAEVLQTLTGFQGQGAQEDDVTVVALRLDDPDEGWTQA